MKVEIWSDVMCPFCYIGKKKFELALEAFPHRDDVQIEWKSFQLMPDLQTGSAKTINEILVKKRGVSMEQAQAMNAQVEEAGRSVGITFNFDSAYPANSFNAHRFAHFAKANGKQNEAEERLFKAHFTEGENIDDVSVLLSLGTDIGLDADKLKTALEADDYAKDVAVDIAEAGQLGVRGVPFFVFDRKQAVSGAQDPTTFLKALELTYADWKKEQVTIIASGNAGGACTIDGTCN